MALTDNLEGFWPLGSDFNDTSGNAKHLTGNGGVSHSSNIIGTFGAALFDGVDDSLSRANAGLGALNATGACSLSMWIKGTVELGGNCRLWFYSDFGSFMFSVLSYNNGPNVYSGTDATGSTSSAAALSDDTLYHLVFTVPADGVTVPKIYLNATEMTLDDPAALGTPVASSSDLEINVGTPFAGNIGLMGFWSRVLSGSEVTELYNSGAGLDPTAAPATAPEAVDDLAATPGANKLTFTWTDADDGGATVSTRTLKYGGAVFATGVTSPYEATNLLGGMFFGPWTVTATNSEGESDPSNAVTERPLIDKTGYSLSQSFPANFSTLTIANNAVNANVTHNAGTAITATGGRQEVNVSHISGSSTAADNAEIVYDTDFVFNYDTANDCWKTNVFFWNNSAVASASDGRPEVIAVQFYDPVFDGYVFFPVGENSNFKVDLRDVNGTSIAGTSTQVAAAFLAQYNVATPVFTNASVNQTGDSYALANGASGFVAIKGDSAAILEDTGTTLPTAIADVPTVAEFEARTIVAANYGTAANQTTIAGYLDTEVAAILAAVDTEIAAILADTNELQTNQGNWVTATGFSTHSAADVVTALGTGSTLTALATQSSVNDLPTNDELATALAGADDAVLAAIDGLNDIDAAAVVTALGTGSSLTALATQASVDGIATSLPSRITKNTALANFPFKMVDSSNRPAGKTGLTITATRSLDGGTFEACANAATEISNGWYKISLEATDLNGNNVVLRFSGTAADTTEIQIVTQP